MGTALRELPGERQGVQVERVDDAVEQYPTQRSLLAVPNLLEDAGDVGDLLDQHDGVDLRPPFRRATAGNAGGRSPGRR